MRTAPRRVKPLAGLGVAQPRIRHTKHDFASVVSRSRLSRPTTKIDDQLSTADLGRKRTGAESGLATSRRTVAGLGYQKLRTELFAKSDT